MAESKCFFPVANNHIYIYIYIYVYVYICIYIYNHCLVAVNNLYSSSSASSTRDILVINNRKFEDAERGQLKRLSVNGYNVFVLAFQVVYD